jgi:hypothetical protein
LREAIERAYLNNQRRRAELDDFVSRSQGSQPSRIGANLAGIFKRRQLNKQLAGLQPQIDEFRRQDQSAMAKVIAKATGTNEDLLSRLPAEDLQKLRFLQLQKQIAPTATTAAPSAVREFQFVQKLNPEQRQQYINLKRSDPLRAKGLVETAEGGVEPIQGVESGLSRVEEAKATGKKTGELDTIKIKEKLPKARSALQSFERKTKVVNREIERVAPLLNQLTTGFAGVPLSKIPGTEAKNVTRLLDTIKSNLGFNQLQEMRDNSPTGGALGQVSEMENRLLQATEGSLEQDQTPEQLLETLQLVQGSIFDIAEQKRKDFKFDFADILGIERPQALPQKTLERPSNDLSTLSDEELLKLLSEAN